MKIKFNLKIIKNFLKIFILLSIISFFAIKINISYNDTNNKENFVFEDICTKKESKSYNENFCKNIGKKAFNTKYFSSNHEIDYGPILGVSLLQKGDNKNYKNAKYIIPVEKESYYYIVGSYKSNYKFLIDVSKVKATSSKPIISKPVVLKPAISKPAIN